MLITHQSQPEWTFELVKLELYKREDGSRAYRFFAAKPGTEYPTRPLALTVDLTYDFRYGSLICTPEISWASYGASSACEAWQYARLLDAATEFAVSEPLF